MLATISREAVEAGLKHVYILSGDRDLWQLISDEIFSLIYLTLNRVRG